MGLFVLALGLRSIHLVTLRSSPFFQHLFLDPLMYDEWGQRIAAGAWIAEGAFFQDPLYAFFLGLVYALFGHHYEPVVVIQAILGSLVAPLLYQASRGWFGRGAATIAGVLAAAYLPSIYYEGLILKTGMAVFLVSLSFFLLSRATTRASGPTWFTAGTVFGLACLCRGNLVLFVPLLWLWILLGDRAPHASARTAQRGIDRARLTDLTRCTAGVAMILAASATHNRLAVGEWILTTSNAGQNFYIGNNPFNSTGEYERLPFVDANPKHEERDFAREAERRTGRSMSSVEISHFWFRAGTSWIREHPLDASRLIGLKLRAYWGAYEIPDNLDYYLYREEAPLLSLPLPGFGFVAPLGLLGVWLAARIRGWPRLLLLFLLVYSLSVVLFFVFSRFRMVMMPALFVFAGFAAMELTRRVGAARSDGAPWRPVITAVAVLLFLLCFVNLPVRGLEHSWSRRLAAAIGLPTRLETTAMAHYNLGLVYAERAGEQSEPQVMLDLAESELRRAIELDPAQAGFHVELGKFLARQQRNEEAMEHYRHAERIEPGDFRTAHALGLLHRRTGELAASEQSFRRALGIAPGHAASAVQLGQILLLQGRSADAARAFRHALQIAPDNTKAREGLLAAEPGR